MEIEAKVNLATEADYLKCVDIFAKDGGEQTVLENYFFDGHAGELAAQGVMLRLRVKDAAAAELTLKTHTEVERGSACRFLDSSTTIPIAVAQAAITDSSALLQVAEVPQALAKYGVSTLKYLGGFRTTRKSCKARFGSEDIKMKLDNIEYPFGKRYELELSCGDVPVHDLFEEVQKVLNANAITGTLGNQNKFQTFMSGCKESMMAPTSFAG
eukprot:Rhum_TRINITY_DN636_c0_g1::Rhum_TRINITY_DN636_c0_g1_i1::g.1936::m.1936